MKIAVIGSGGREHALVWRLQQEDRSHEVIAIPGNGGTHRRAGIDPGDIPAIKSYLEQERVDLAVVGPEMPLVEGIVDLLVDSRVRVFGPTRAAARLEGSKIWAKEFMRRHGVATANFQVYREGADPSDRIRELDGDLVVKYDGLAAGKGVYVCGSVEEAWAAIDDIQSRYGRWADFLIEQRLRGVELSILGFTDGREVKLLPPSQDHKQLLDGDRGPNTGGMGATCPVPFCDEQRMGLILDRVVRPTLAGLQAEGLPYCGVIYFGLMVTSDGPQLLEYNVRLGDPEAEVLLPALESSLVELIGACFEGTLGRYEMRVSADSFVDVVLASGGYPSSYPTGFEITGLDRLDPDILVFHAGTRVQEGRLVTAGGRVLNVVGRGPDLQTAIQKAYGACETIRFENMVYRKDIGRRDNRL